MSADFERKKQNSTTVVSDPHNMTEHRWLVENPQVNYDISVFYS